MRIIVKFGGTSVQNPERIKKAAQSIIQQAKKGCEIIAVVSAMGNTTDNLTSLLITHYQLLFAIFLTRYEIRDTRYEFGLCQIQLVTLIPASSNDLLIIL
ncbi:unnamed protein product, partial [marine sediment metagenome]